MGRRTAILTVCEIVGQKRYSAAGLSTEAGRCCFWGRIVLTYGSLFSGAGGMDLGFDAAGWECRWQVEIDTVASSVLARNWPLTKRYSDVVDVVGSNIEPVDVISGGFPCQDLSVAGRSEGFDGARSRLFHDFVRVVKEMRRATQFQYPRFVVWENVVGLLSVAGGLATVYAGWDEAGAMVQEHRVVDGQYFGVPQRRRRVVGVVGFDPAAERAGAILADAEDMSRHHRPSATTQAAGAGTRRSGVGTRRLVAETGVVGSLTVSFSRSPDAAHAQAGWLVPDGDGIRKLTCTECERLMGWPDDHTRWTASGEEIRDAHRYRMCGNGVIAPMATWLANRVGDAAWTLTT